MYNDRVTIIGAGFIGQHLARVCLDAGLRVAVLDRHPCPNEFLGRVRWVAGDASEVNCLTAAVKGSSVVYHLVGGIRRGQLMQDTGAHTDVSLKLTAGIAACCAALSVNRIVMTSSAAVYGVQSIAKIKESTTAPPISSYGIHKWMHEQAFVEACKLAEVDQCIVRLANPYGIALNSTKQDGLVPALMTSVKTGSPFFLFGDGTATRDFIAVEDVSRALLLCGTRPTVPKVLNIGSGQGFTVNQLVKLVDFLSGKRIEVQYLAKNPTEMDYSVLDVELAQDILGFNAEINLEKGLGTLLANNALS